LELLKRHFGTQAPELEEIAVERDEPSTTSLLVYNGRGRILRVELTSDDTELGRLADKLDTSDEPPRLLAVPSNEEVLLLYSSGRVSTHSVGKLSTVDVGNDWTWEEAALPDEPRAGETLVCIAPFSHLPMSDFFLQVSRRGYIKRTTASMAQNILSNHFIGRGTLKKADQAIDLTLCNQGARFAFVTYEGKLVGLEIDDLSYTIEARISMSASDYVIASCLPRPDDALIFVTQTGKVLHRESSLIETTKSSSAKGQALISPNRLGQGVRFMGAAALQDADRVAVLDAGGQIKVYEARAMTGSGSIGSGELILSIGVIPSPNMEPSNP